MAAFSESGNLLPILSLGGVVSQPGKGRKFDTIQYNVSTPAYPQVLNDNPERISALIQNLGPDNVAINAPGTQASITLTLLGVLQIDRNFPWTGPMLATSPGVALLNVTEISLQ